jgi:hypothetical protein
LNEIKVKFGQTRWFIKGDIEAQFDTVNHHILMSSIGQKVGDKAFLDLLWKALRAGYKKKGKPVIKNMAGLPKGGVISPILSNIYMDIFDKKMDKLKCEFDKGNRRQSNPLYNKLIKDRRKNLKEGKANLTDLLHIPSTNLIDPNFKRLKYVRYADDFLIGVIGSKQDCVVMRERIRKFLHANLGMQLNMTKTTIVNAQDREGVKFLGYTIKMASPKSQPFKRIKRAGQVRLSRTTLRPTINAPINDIAAKLREAKYARGNSRSEAHPTRCGRLIHLPDYAIIEHYCRVERSILNYYKIASNYGKFVARVHFILKYSCALTLASKNRLKTLKKTFNKYGYNLCKLPENAESKRYHYPTPDYSKPLIKGWEFAKKTDPHNRILQLCYAVPRGISELRQPCTICGSKKLIEIHHVKALSKNKSKDFLTQTMQRMNRKQVPLCKECHIKVHKGIYNGPKIL